MSEMKGFKLEWEIPPAATEVLLFKVDGNTPPETVVTKNGPAVKGGKLILRGKKGAYIDSDVQPGKTYTYIIFAGYGGGQFSPKGVVKTLTVPMPPSAVEDLKGVFDEQSKRVHLRWHNPNPQWDSVTIRRQLANGKYREVAQGRITQFDDSSIEAGRCYKYELHVIHGQFTSPTRTVEVVCQCPVNDFVGEYDGTKGVVNLKWQIPPAARAVYLCRAVGGKVPTLREQGGKPVVSDKDLLLRSDRGSSHTDMEVYPGQTYTYVAVAIFNQGVFVASNAVQVSIPKLPKPPVGVSVEFDTNSFIVRWTGLKNSTARYRVYRKMGADAPVSPDDGELIEETEQVLIRDGKDIKAGTWYAYSVFSVRGDQMSREPASSRSHGALYAPKNVQATAEGKIVHVKWDVPSSAECVLVAAADNAPPVKFRGSVYHRLQPQGVFSETVDYGTTRGYLVACGYRGLDGNLHPSKPYRVTVAIDPPLGMIEEFDVAANHARENVCCRWSTNGIGQIQIYRLPAPHHLVPDSEHELATLVGFHRIQPEHVDASLGEWVDEAPDPKRPWYCSVLLSPSGKNVRIGPSQMAGVVPSLENLSIKRKGNGLALTLDWPKSVEHVEVKAKFHDPPTTQTVHASQKQFLNWGREIRLHPKMGEGLYRYTVTPCHGEIRGTSCRIDHQWIGAPRQLHVFWQPRRDGIRFSWRLVGDPLPSGYQFGGVRLLANASCVPLHHTEPDTVVVAESPVNLIGDSGNGSTIPYSHIAKCLSAGNTVERVFLRAEFVTPELDHGNLLLAQCGCSAVPLNLKIKKYIGEEEQVRVEKYSPQATDFICPQCWKQYPVEEMLYADSDELPENTPLHRFRRMKTGGLRLFRKKQPPGQYKYCPGENKHLQGKFAGTVSNRLIGLLGPTESGKTYYIASVLQALHEESNNTMESFLTSLDDRTRERTDALVVAYRSGKKLASTPLGRSEYLNYLLTVGERHWNPAPSRSLLFSVQDTGGENLRDETFMRTNLPHLDFCSGLILVVDPLQFPKVREKLDGVVDLPELREATKAQNILGRLRNILNDRKQSEIPLALVITKCDVLLETGLLSDVNLWGWENTTKRQNYSWDHHNDMTGLFAAFMQEYEAATYHQAIDQFPIHAFFGVSATGTSEQDAQGRFVRIESKHVLEPIWWMLATMDMIRTSRMKW